MDGAVGLRLQGLDVGDQALVLARIAEGRVEGPVIEPAGVRDLFFEMGLPTPDHIGNVFAGLERQGLLTKGKDRGAWKLTPHGRARSVELLADTDLAALEAEAARAGATRLGLALHSLVPPALAPAVLLQPLTRFLEAHPFERNVFGMTRFPEDVDDDPPDPVAPALEVARDVCERHGLELHLASDRAIHDDLWTNVAGHMWASRFGIAFFEDRRALGVNYNLTIEVGAMLMTGRRCALLKDSSIERMPTDLVGMIYKPVDLDDRVSVEDVLHGWIRDDLGLGACDGYPGAQASGRSAR